MQKEKIELEQQPDASQACLSKEIEAAQAEEPQVVHPNRHQRRAAEARARKARREREKKEKK